MEEIEIKFLEIDVPELEKKLTAIGAEKAGEYDYHRATFDFPDWRLNTGHAWLRLRTDGKETTLTYKQRLGVKANDGSISDEGMKEIEIIVDDYEKTYELLKSIGFIIKREQENKRIKYIKDNVHYDIDFWPKIPTFLEVEGPSLAEVKEAAKELGFNPEDGLIGSAKQVYKKYGFEENDYTSMTFNEWIKA
ncbi:MAG: class IV adenylate cyclase [Patescibacteria group bacterium]